MSRIVRKTLEFRDRLETQITSAVGEVAEGEDSVSGRVRRLYTRTYKSLDQFDQLWYLCTYEKRDRRWQTAFAWAVILDCVINARSAYCEYTSSSEPMKAFITILIAEIRAYCKTINE